MLSGQVQMLCDVESHPVCTTRRHPKPFHFTWNSKWFYVKFQVKISVWFAAQNYSHDSCFGYLCFPDNFKWSVMTLWRLPVCVPSEAIPFHLEFQVILCDSKWNSKWRYLCKKVLPLYLFRIFRLSVRIRMLWGAEIHRMCYSILLICISLGIPSDSMWNSKWTYFSGLREKSVLMVVVLYLYGFWESSSALWCMGHCICRDNFTWNFT